MKVMKINYFKRKNPINKIVIPFIIRVITDEKLGKTGQRSKGRGRDGHGTKTLSTLYPNPSCRILNANLLRRKQK
jgi:hypothetical protein